MRAPEVSHHGARANRSRIWLNDCHSRLNRTAMAGVARPASLSELIEVLRAARIRDVSVIPFGGRHAMGGQQFGTGAIAIDTRGLNRVLGFDRQSGVIEIEAGITWPEILDWLNRTRSDHGCAGGDHGWAIAQKQTGADRLTIGGALAANVHGRGLTKAPIIEDVESLTLIDPEGRLIECDRSSNRDLFFSVIGGYGLFGIVYSVRLRLEPRRKLERVVRSAVVETVMERFEKRIDAGFRFGDFQFQIDDASDDFLNRGIFSCYRPVDDDAEMAPDPPLLGREDWLRLLHLAHVDKRRGFELYEGHYRRTDGSLHWSDSHQFTIYVDGYHDEIDRRMKRTCRGSEMISELYVPRAKLADFLCRAREDLRRFGASVIYGTVRLIELDRESLLPWARQPWACVIFNLCVEHSREGIANARRTFRGLIDRALEFDGCYYLTYHRFARRDQVEAAYPGFREFLRRKLEWDPRERFQSDWYCHHQALLR